MTLTNERPHEPDSNNPGPPASSDAARARALVEEGLYAEAEQLITRAVRELEDGGAATELAVALTTQGVALARLGRGEESAEVIRRALETAEEAGANSVAGAAALTLVEEHALGGVLAPEELLDVYREADRLLEKTRHAESAARLRNCARLVMRRLAGVQLGDESFTLFDAVHEIEARLIARALEEAEGSVTRAAQLLGLRHQTFLAMLNTRHQHLMDKRKPRGKRRRSIIKRWD
ncbi:MAG TPA: helix-turn-helix domain-containing protein [Pyrinomonadaceae bacterium]|nr:helix-turn-helix domain-containing protein [Pyrinomonadaceae bacterium]